MAGDAERASIFSRCNVKRAFIAVVGIVALGSACRVKSASDTKRRYGVGRAATSAVVFSAVMILVLDAFWAVTWLLGRDAS